MSELISFIPCDYSEVSSGKYKKIELSNDQKSQLSFALSQMPEMAAAEAMSKLYYIKYPEGVSGPLMQLKRPGGGYTTSIMGKNGIIAQGALHNLSAMVGPAQLFSLMAIASGNHYLSLIHNEIGIINKKIDDILGFLYGDKKAELISEISFVQYAYDSYSSIMQHGEQRSATIANLQIAKKVAMKDIEFYSNRIQSDAEITEHDYKKFVEKANNIFENQQSLEYAMQLFAMSGIMEAYFSQNVDESYINYLKFNMIAYIEKCNHQITSSFNMLKGSNNAFAVPNKFVIIPLPQKDIAPLGGRIEKVLDKFSPEKSEIKSIIEKSLNALTLEPKYCISTGGDLYISV